MHSHVWLPKSTVGPERAAAAGVACAAKTVCEVTGCSVVVADIRSIVLVARIGRRCSSTQKAPQRHVFWSRGIRTEELIHISVGCAPARRGIGLMPNECVSRNGIANQSPAIAVRTRIDVGN